MNEREESSFDTFDGTDHVPNFANRSLRDPSRHWLSLSPTEVCFAFKEAVSPTVHS